MQGRTISHYEIQEKLGAGGMGDIYRAQDTRLNRSVAIKVLASSGTEGTGRRRFIQEAQAASALNHPNIITIHDIVAEENVDFMVMEFVAGKTLVDLIPQGGLGLRDTLRYGVQIADALETAHAAGIIHRDLKPGNVMVTGTGLVKILDFGLAKFTGKDSGINLNDATLTHVDAPLTIKGSIIGTVSYMSPEQAQGRTVDHRSDIFAFGLLLYEMITGCRAFQSDSTISTLSSILRDDVRPIRDTIHDVPPDLEQIIGRALKKNADERWQSIKEVKEALELLKFRTESGTIAMGPGKIPAAAPQVRQKSSIVPMLLAAAIGLSLAAGAGIWWKVHRDRLAAQAQAQAVVQTPAPAPEAQAVPAPPPPDAAPPGDQDAVLTNQSVIDMVEAKVSQNLIVNQIRNSKNKFNLSTAEVIRLSKAGVSDAVIEVMRNPARPAVTASVGTPKSSAPTTPATQQVPAVVPATPAPSQPSAQPATTPPAPQPAPAPAAPATHPVEVADGLPFVVRLMEDVPNAPQAGQVLRFEVAKELRIGNTVVIGQGSVVTGEILDAGKKKILGKTQKPTFRLVHASAVDGTKFNLRATPSHGKTERSLEVPGHTVPKDLAAAAGTEYIAYTEGVQTVAVK